MNKYAITKKEIMDMLVNNPDMTAREALYVNIGDHSLNDELYAAEQKKLPFHERDKNKDLASLVQLILRYNSEPLSATDICNIIWGKTNEKVSPNTIVTILKSMYGSRLIINTKEVNVTTTRKIKVYSI